MTAAHNLPHVTFSVSNRWTTIECVPETQVKLKKFFRYRTKDCEFKYSYIKGTWDGYRCLLNNGAVPTGLFLETCPEISKQFNITIKDRRRFPCFREVITSEKERPYQKEAVEAMIKASSNGGLILAATGVGKTFLAAEYMRRLDGMSVFIVDELALLEQSRRALEAALGEKVGVVGRSEFDPRRVTVATVQTLARNKTRSDFKKWFSSIDVMIIDEIHLALNKSNIDVVTEIEPTAVFGLTATLQIQKPHVRIPATALAGPVVFTYSIQDGVEQEYLTPGTICFLEFRDPLPKGQALGYWTQIVEHGKRIKRWIQAGSPDAEYRYHISLNKARNDCIEQIVREGIKRGRKIVLLAERIQHLLILSKRLGDLNHKTLYGAVNPEIRIEAMKAMDAGELSLILASRVFGKGVDIQKVDTIIDATARPGHDGAIQRYGRGVRKSAGKKELLYVDISDSGKFSFTSRQRKTALMEVGARTVNLIWKNDAEAIYNSLEKRSVLDDHGDK